ncbi:hypothetical protein Tco_1022604 [Tanacetum coccineum]
MVALWDFMKRMSTLIKNAREYHTSWRSHLSRGKLLLVLNYLLRPRDFLVCSTASLYQKEKEDLHIYLEFAWGVFRSVFEMVKERCLKVSLGRICDEMAKEFQPELRSLMLLQFFMVRIVLDLMRRGEHVSFELIARCYITWNVKQNGRTGRKLPADEKVESVLKKQNKDKLFLPSL